MFVLKQNHALLPQLVPANNVTINDVTNNQDGNTVKCNTVGENA